jgi:SNF2 family DNA or RNA helicase
MKVSTSKPFQIIYSLFQHEYLGYLFESFVVQLDDYGRLTLQNQNISSQNAHEFSSGLDSIDFELIKIMDSMQQTAVVRFFSNKPVKPGSFFPKIYQNKEANKILIDEIESYLEKRRAKILPLLKNNKQLFEMGSDGEPTWKPIEIMPMEASVLFHFRRNEENTHYFPTISYNREKLNFQYNGSFIICKNPAWLIAEGKLYNFEKKVDGNKLLPFLNKKFIIVPRKVEETYFRKFVAPLVAAFDVYAKGFTIITENHEPHPVISLNELTSSKVLSLFGDEPEEEETSESKMVLSLEFRYGSDTFRTDVTEPVSVSLEKTGNDYKFIRIRRNLKQELKIKQLLLEQGFEFIHGKLTLEKSDAFERLILSKKILDELGVELIQPNPNNRRYFIGEALINIEIRENIDWFDIYAVVKFGNFTIPFQELRKFILKKQKEFELPNGEIAVIPDFWIQNYSEFFAFVEEKKGRDKNLVLKKHHLALVQDMEESNLAKVNINNKLKKLKSFVEFEDYPMPAQFRGQLRPYQKAGFNWLKFLNKFNFGGCLADDMGLGKTVQTLAMLQSEKEKGNSEPSLLVMPTSLIYNWEKEAQVFTPELRTLNYTGTNRCKDIRQFEDYDLILTSYGIIRLDIDIIKDFYFNYIILDESQAIKNPNSNISRAVKKLDSKFKLILTGTPLENSTLDLWSQMTFINPGLLGTQNFFRHEFLNPIEKKKDELKTSKLYSIIKPFILRRHKSQVATELPEKIIKVHYSSMTTMQEEQYEKARNFYRNKVLEQIETFGVKQSQFILLQGLTRLRQLANHPKLVEPDYLGDSGKLEDVIFMLHNALSEKHKILIFSQFVKHLALLKDYLDLKNLDYCYLDGSTRDRKSQVERFQNDDEVKLFLISLKAGGLGLNLTKADFVFILDPWWNPAIETQAEDRAHRIGQQNKVFTYKFITKNTVEEKILSLQQHKMKLAREIISTEESFVKELSREDIESLFN